MLTLIRLTAVVAAIVFSGAPAAGDGQQIVSIGIAERATSDANTHRVSWRLGLINGELAFLATRPDLKDEPGMPTIPRDTRGMRADFHWILRGDTLQIQVDQARQPSDKVEAEKNDWYLTAKYSDNGAEVVLTKDSTKHSHWGLVDKEILEPKEITRFHLRNNDDSGKTAWLGMDAKGVRYRGHIEMRKPLLSQEKRHVEFNWRSGY
jgi:hypothetical protein